MIILPKLDHQGRIAIVVAICLVLFPTISTAALLNLTGKLTMLRVQQVGEKFGPPGDSIDVEVIVNLDSQQGKAFGFKLREGSNSIAHAGMLNILRDAFSLGHTVTIGAEIDADKSNGIIRRVWVTK